MSANLDQVRRIDFDRLDMLVSERIAALKLYAQNIDKADGGVEVHDAICRDLIMPCVYTLVQFIDSVNLNAEDGEQKLASSNEAKRQ